ncbi:MAG: hypothetical protein WCO07_01250 [bacterium]
MKPKIFFDWDKETVELLLPVIIKNEPDLLGKEVYFVSEGPFYGLKFALEISSNPANLVIFCSASDERSFFSHYDKEIARMFGELMSRKNVKFFQIPFAPERIKNLYRNFIAEHAN